MKPIKGSLQFKTNYNFKVYRDGVLRQEENTHNVVVDAVLYKKVYQYYNRWYYGGFGATLRLGSGTGTPASTDTALFSSLWAVSRQSYSILGYDDETNSMTIRYIYEVPATSSYVGTITECAIWGESDDSRMYTHALIKDAEGNPISIVKTDLDKIVITVDLTISIGSSDEDVLTKSIRQTIIPRLMYGNSTGRSHFYYLNCTSNSSAYTKSHVTHLIQSPVEFLTRPVGYYDDSYTGPNLSDSGTIYPSTATTIVESDNVRRCTGRLNVDLHTSAHKMYIKGLMLFGAWVIKFPNEKYFPAYKLEGIEVGTATGGETEMLCPLDYFVDQSEVVYKNGVALTRDVDYTVVAHNNHSALIELAESNDAVITGGKIVSSNYACHLFRPKPTASSTLTYTINTIATDAPVFLDMGKEVSVNFLRVPNTGSYKYTLSYSMDGDIYEALEPYTSNGTYIWEFAEVTARYFKLEITSTSGGSVTFTPYVSTASVISPAGYFALGHKTDGMIKFTQALAAGDVITMECMMDLPYKTENNVIEYDFSVSI